MKVVIIEEKVSEIMLVWNLENVSQEPFLVLKTAFLHRVYSITLLLVGSQMSDSYFLNAQMLINQGFEVLTRTLDYVQTSAKSGYWF